jgi:D-sedoheptulose 7-phosphate isomerase
LRDFEGQKRLRVLSLTDNVAWIMAVANDLSYEGIFLEQLKNLASPGDLLLAISGSGNSPNVLRAVEWANAHGLTTVGITGFSGGQLRPLAHHGLHVDVDDMGLVESLHLTVFHWVIDDLNRRFAESAAPVAVGA